MLSSFISPFAATKTSRYKAAAFRSPRRWGGPLLWCSETLLSFAPFLTAPGSLWYCPHGPEEGMCQMGCDLCAEALRVG